MIHEFVTSPRIIYGPGSLERIGEVASSFGHRVLMVTGGNAMKKAGVISRIAQYLEKAGIDSEVFDGVSGEPTYETVDSAAGAARNLASGIITGLGGGSAMDVAKAVSFVADKPGSIRDYMSMNADSKGLPCIAIPTTAGTGAEVTVNAVLIDPDKPVKTSIRGAGLLPDAVIVDPELTLSLPPEVTAYSGMDALTQAIESYVSRGASILTESLSFKAVELIWTNLLTAFRKGDDLDAREKVMMGSLLAGMALTNARLGLVHGLAHPVGVRYRIPHGLICALLLSHEIRFNLLGSYDLFDRTYEKYSCIAGMMGFRGSKPEGIADAIDRLNGELGIEGHLRRFGLKEEDFPLLAEESLPSDSLRANPKPVTKSDLVDILRDAF